MARSKAALVWKLLVCLMVFQVAGGLAQSQVPAKTTPSVVTGVAIYYSDKLVGRPLATGEKYDKNALTAAHRTLPFGTMVKVTT